MGTFRFLLAVLVMLSHFPGVYLKSNLGQSAVLAFYFISGWLMAMSYARFKAKTSSPNSAFFIDRAIKIWPSYALVFLVSLVFFWSTGVFQFDWRRVPLELLVIPNAFTKMIPWNEAHALTIVPPAWSLGVEACFYLTVPLLALLSYRASIALAYLLAAGHLVVLMIGSPIGRIVQCGGFIRETLCTIPISDYLGMDFPALVGVTFLLGHIAYVRYRDNSKSDNHLAIIWAVYLLVFLVVAPYTGRIANLSTYDVLFAMCFLLPAALVALELTRSRPQTSWDKWLGDMSYPLFLSHFLARYIIEYLFGRYEDNQNFYLQAIVLSLLLSIAVMQFQKSVDNLRYAVRGFSSARRSVAGAPHPREETPRPSPT